MKNKFKFLTRLSLFLVYLVILAGATVRMTGSGMGCPDWPKCFGYYIPPVEQSQVLFQPNSKYYKGEMIIYNEEKLLVAKSNFISSNFINLNNWGTYEKHDYIIFNPVHTWIEYINRLIGAISGIPILLFTIISVVYFKKYKHLTFISILTVLCMGFQAWLGKTVVDSNLAPFKITFHMLMALLIIALLIYLVNSSSKFTIKKNNIFTNFLFVAVMLTLIQIVLGTQVRQFVDEQANVYYDKFQWFNEIPKVYEYHRTFSLVVIAVNFGLFYLNKKLNLGNNYISYVIVLLFIEALSGVVMFYFDFPFGSQTIHLFIASLIFGFQFYILLQNITFKNKLNYDI
ncbi:MAG: heme A synthase [Bacteroidetes bacterium MED-G13]|nr:MAG: heme A synthase [Bacteroidetes bacterium MED-G13]